MAQAAEPHPHIYNAYRMLRRAHYVLQRSCRNLSGERANALSQIDAALNELKLAIAVDHGTLPLMTESLVAFCNSVYAACTWRGLSPSSA